MCLMMTFHRPVYNYKVAFGALGGNFRGRVLICNVAVPCRNDYPYNLRLLLAHVHPVTSG